MLNLVQDQFANLFEQNATMEARARSMTVQKAGGLPERNAKRLARLDTLVEIAGFIEAADLRECKHIINELIDRVSEITGSAKELEDAAVMLTKAIDGYDIEAIHLPECRCDDCVAARSDEHFDRRRDAGVMAYMESRDEP